MMENQEQEKIAQIAQNIHQLPTLPTIYSRLNRMISNPKSTARSISRVIEEDQALTTKILKIINSAFYSFHQRISTISHAVVILGFNEVKNIALAASVIDLFQNGGDTYTFNHEAFWKHSLATAVCSRIIAKKMGGGRIKDPEEAFTAGLVHDIGKLVEDQFMHDDFVRIMQQCGEKEIPFIEAEKKTVGFTHQDVGMFLAEKWNLPLSFIETIGSHNTPALKKTEETAPIIAVVHLANILVHVLELGFAGDAFVPQFDEQCWNYLDLKKSHLEVIMDETEQGFNEVSSLIMQESK